MLMSTEPKPSYPILYSFRRCPYAIRARLALHYSSIQVELREVILRNKPSELIEASSKATVPVLIVNDGIIIDESLDIMLWALEQNDFHHWLPADSREQESTTALIKENDTDFKHWLDRYKYVDRHPEFSEFWYRQQCERFLVKLEQLLTDQPFLQGERFGLADAAIAPFIRQFALVDKNWFAESHYRKIKLWLNNFMQGALFSSVMHKYSQWQTGDEPIYFPQDQD